MYLIRPNRLFGELTPNVENLSGVPAGKYGESGARYGEFGLPGNISYLIENQLFIIRKINIYTISSTILENSATSSWCHSSYCLENSSGNMDNAHS